MLVDAVRQEISPNKIGWRDWAAVMEEAHALGMRTTATMMFGSRERPEDIVEHLFRVREIQARTGGFTAFIPWTYQPGGTELGGETASGVEYLKVLALSRIVLDNVPNIQASWVTQGAMMAQVSLFFGANDLGGTMLEENVVAAAGCSFRLSQGGDRRARPRRRVHPGQAQHQVRDSGRILKTKSSLTQRRNEQRTERQDFRSHTVACVAAPRETVIQAFEFED